ncbi:phage tail tape measure protein [Methylibium sp.]|uniref:phage tail tape measure protein n=1 Tax=Methylibium sp. TaxID=2067992 RepID=UPI00183EB7A6|nr:phage tail tape measure protein [Methylibium sp.]MBA3588305.1 phage tail tape measure protein [Methylibium sp.]
MADLKAQLELTADASGVEAGVTRAKKSIASLGQSASTAGKEASKAVESIGTGAGSSVAKVDAATKNLIGSINRTTAALEAGSRSSSKYFEVLAQQRGVSVDALRPYLTQLDAVSKKQDLARTALGAGSIAFNQYGVSAKQTAAALRQVPAQLTDIIVGLQGGQAPLTVLLQQGGQLKDVFGGIAPAARALGGALIGLINPFTIVAGTAALLAAAYNSGSKEADAYNRALILTGNAAGTTAGQLAQIAESISGVAGTQGKAADALAQLAATGKVARGSLELVALAAVKLERTAGKAIKETVKEFAELGKDPVSASAKLNEQYNFLTLAVFEQIKALEEQGKTTEAVALAQKTFADEVINRADQLTENLGLVERAWLGIRDGAKLAWDAMLNVGRAETPEGELQGLRDQLSARIARGPTNNLPSVVASFEKGNEALRRQIDALAAVTTASASAAQAEAERARVTKAGIAAEVEISKIREASRTNTQKLNDELKKYRENLDAIRKANPQSTLLDPKRIAADEANIRARFTPKGRTPVVRDDAATRLLQQLREAEAVSVRQLATDEKLTASEQRRAEFLQQIADLKDKKILTADQKSLLASQEAIKSQLERNVAIEKEVEARAEATKEIERQQKALERFQDRAAQIAESISSANAQRSEQFDSRLQVFGRGSQAREQLEANIAIQREFQRFQEQLNKATPKELLGSDLYLEEVARIKAGLAEATADNAKYFADITAAQADWKNGATRAYEDYLTAARDVAGQTEQVFSRAFGSLEDTVTDFVLKGKASFKDFGESLARDLIQSSVRQSIGLGLEALGKKVGPQSQAGGVIGALGGGAAQAASQAAATATQTAAITTAITTASAAQSASIGGAIAAASATETASLSAALTATSAASSASISAAVVASAASIVAAIGASAAAGAGGDALGGFISGLGAASGRAIGGPVSAGQIYEVNEKGAPEVASIGGKDYLLTGSQGGKVTPAGASQGSSVVVTVNQSFQPGTDRSTVNQAAARAGSAVQRAVSRVN